MNCINNGDVMLFTNDDVILQSEGGGGQKRPKKLRSYLMYGPLGINDVKKLKVNLHIFFKKIRLT